MTKKKQVKSDLEYIYIYIIYLEYLADTSLYSYRWDRLLDILKKQQAS
jgi:hypothetical protein